MMPPAPTFGRKRRLLIATNVLVMCGAAVAVALIVIYLAMRPELRGRIDLTEEKLYTLSEKTRRVLENLHDDVRITTLFRASHYDPKQKLPIPGFGNVIQDVAIHTMDLLREYQFASRGRVQPEFLDANNARDLKRITEVMQKSSADYNSVIVRYGSGDHVRGKILNLDDLADIDRGNFTREPVRMPRLNGYRGEEVLTTTIIGITEQQAPVIAFLQGHGEPDPNDRSAPPTSIYDFALALGADNFGVLTLPAGVTAIPDAVSILAIVNPVKDVPESELALIQAFMHRGGRLFLALDPGSTHTLDDALLAPFELRREYKVICEDKSQGPYVDPAKTQLVVSRYNPDSPVVAYHRKGNLYTLFRDAGAIKASTNARKPKWLCMTTSGAWEEKITERDETHDPATEPTGVPLVLGYQVELGEEYHGARLIVFGDSDWLQASLMRDGPGNKDLAVNACDWLAGRESLIGIAPRSYLQRAADLTPKEYAQIFSYTVIMMPLCGVVLGLLVWWMRRK